MSIDSLFTDRHGGVSAPPYAELNLGLHVGDDEAAVRENRRRACMGPVAWMSQVHGRAVAVVKAEPSAPVPETDALVTAVPNLWLAVLVADCAPVLLADPVAGVVAAAHAGRLGMIRGVIPNTVDAMCRLGAEPSQIVAEIGPAICAGCYELPEETVAQTASNVPAARAVTRWGSPAVDLRAGIQAQLREAGVVGTVQVSPRCTAEEPDLYSHRRDGVTGRFAGFIRRSA